MKRIILSTFLLFVLLFPNEKTAFLIPIQGDIDMGLPYFIERSIDLAKEEKPNFVLFNIDTFGGRVDAATKIKDSILGCPIPTIAFINRRAISAGALISLSCDSIYMTSGATIGAATAVDQSGEKASEKVISYMREEMASTAEANGRDRNIAAAMVDEELEIPYILSIDGDTLTSNEVAGFKEGKLVTLSTNYAIQLGIANQELETLDEIMDHLGIDQTKIIESKPSWSENLVRFLTNPMVAPLLMTLGFIGLLFEIKSPGFGFPGAAGLFCLSLFFGSHLLVGLADIWEIILMFTGLFLIILEIFVIPGFGIAGIGGGGLMLWSMYKMLLGEYPAPDDIQNALFGLNIGIVGAVVAGILLFKFLTRSKFYHRVVPITSQKKSDGYSVSKGFEILIGKSGISITDLRPAGMIAIEGKRYQSMTIGEYIEEGCQVIVEGLNENQLVVKELNK